MTKQGGNIKSWKRRYFKLLADGNMHYFKDHTAGVKSAALGIIEVRSLDAIHIGIACAWKSNAGAVRDVPMEARLELVASKRTWCIFCDSVADAALWGAVLNTVRESPPL